MRVSVLTDQNDGVLARLLGECDCEVAATGSLTDLPVSLDIVLVDLDSAARQRMPELRRTLRTPTFFVGFGAHFDDEAWRSRIREGYNLLLRKPLDRDQLRALTETYRVVKRRFASRTDEDQK